MPRVTIKLEDRMLTARELTVEEIREIMDELDGRRRMLAAVQDRERREREAGGETHAESLLDMLKSYDSLRSGVSLLDMLFPGQVPGLAVSLSTGLPLFGTGGLEAFPPSELEKILDGVVAANPIYAAMVSRMGQLQNP